MWNDRAVTIVWFISQEHGSLTLHFIVEGQFLSSLDVASGKKRYPGQSLIKVINKNIIHLQVGLTLRDGQKCINNLKITLTSWPTDHIQ